MTAEVKGFVQQQGQKSRLEVGAKRTGLGPETGPAGTVRCNYPRKNRRKVTLRKYEGLRILAAASCHRNGIRTTARTREASENTGKWLSKVREHSAAGVAIGELEGENCFTAQSCAEASVVCKLMV